MKGEITINGEVVTSLGYKVTSKDEVVYKGKVISAEKKVYVLLNKPKGFVTTMDDPHAEKTVITLVQNACPERIYPVGRLDKDTTGLLLFTNDGEMTKKLTHPSYEKTASRYTTRGGLLLKIRSGTPCGFLYVDRLRKAGRS